MSETKDGRRPPGQWVILALILLTVATVAGIAILRRSIEARRAQERFESSLRAEHPGLIAWFEGVNAKVIDVADLPGAEKVKTFEFDGPLKLVFFSTDGRTLFGVITNGKNEKARSIVALDLATGLQRTVLDLPAAHLEQDDIDLSKIWVTPHGDAEAETDRIVFKLNQGDLWYSVEGKRPRIRPAPGRPEKPWDQTVSPDGKIRLGKDSDDSTARLCLTDGKLRVLVSEKLVTAPGAWWCR